MVGDVVGTKLIVVVGETLDSTCCVIEPSVSLGRDAVVPWLILLMVEPAEGVLSVPTSEVVKLVVVDWAASV